MRQGDGQSARTEAELRAVLVTLERHAPELETVLGVITARAVRRRSSGRRLLLGGGLAMAAGATAAGLVIATAGVNPVRVAPPRQVKLAASMVRHVAKVSSTAIAAAGHVVVTYSNVADGVPNGSGTLNITFSGENFNSVSLLPKAKPYIEREVNGQLYTLGNSPLGGSPAWYHEAGQNSPLAKPIPDPRDLLFSLRPEAGFVIVGWQVLDGMRLEQLQATNLDALPSAKLALGMKLPAYHLTSLEIWVDTQAIVQRMAMKFQATGPGAARLNAQSFLVKFLDIGLAQTITPPPHYVSQHTNG